MPEPDLSVVLAAEDTGTLERGLRALAAQTSRERIELVLVSLSGEPFAFDAGELDAFAGHQLVHTPPGASLAEGRALGVRAARGRYVHIGETHAFPEPEWAERVIDSFDPKWSAIVAGIENANPDGAISWANLLIDYGRWSTDLPGGEIDSTPPYNTAFERSFALHALEISTDAFAPGFDLTGLLRSEGLRILFQPAARIAHVNVSVAAHWLGQRYTGARMRAGMRCRGWPLHRRLVYAVGSPLIPVLLAARLAPTYVTVRRARSLPALTVPAILVGLAAVAGGELAGFVGGEDAAVVRRADSFELHKIHYTATS
jgi:hypothetical protein